MSAFINKTVALAAAVALCVPLHASAQVTPEDQYFIKSSFAIDHSKKISMDFKGAALTDVLKIFSKQSGLNFIANKDISGKKVTLYMENIPVDEALRKILDANGLAYTMDEGSNVFIVGPKDSTDPVITRVYALRHASVPMAKLNTAIKITGQDSVSSSSTTSFGAMSGSSSNTSSGSSGGYASGIYAAVKMLLSKNGVMIEDARTNSLIITDITSRFPLIEDTIAKLDVPVPQILIQVEMLDISKTASDLLGVKWGPNMLRFKGAAKPTIWPFNQSAYLQKPGTQQPTISGGDSEEGLAYEAGVIDAREMTAVLNLLQTRTDTRNLARPRLLTLNNETAEIKISTDEAIGKKTSTVGNSGDVSTTSVEAERKPTGVFLTVTPQADLTTNEILMAVNPKVIQARIGGTFGTETFKDVEERSTQSLLKVKDGETIIIGGLMRTDDGSTLTKVPFLGSIPLIGAAFRHKDKAGNKRELVIFLTPRIVRDGSSNPLVNNTIENFEQTHYPAQTQEVEKALSTIEDQRY